jgi:hypothetical protein
MPMARHNSEIDCLVPQASLRLPLKFAPVFPIGK